MAAVEYQNLLKLCESQNYVKRICGCLCQPVIATVIPSSHLLRQLFLFLAHASSSEGFWHPCFLILMLREVVEMAYNKKDSSLSEGVSETRLSSTAIVRSCRFLRTGRKNKKKTAMLEKDWEMTLILR